MSDEKLLAVAIGLHGRFPNGSHPCPILPRLLEESGGLAQEIMDVLRCGLQVAIHYGVEEELEGKINELYENMKREGWIASV